MNKVDISISRTFHDWLLGYNEKELNTMYSLHKVSWSISGPTFRDVGVFYRNWIQDAQLGFIQSGKETGIDLLVRYRK
jgi:hypothetical protein